MVLRFLPLFLLLFGLACPLQLGAADAAEGEKPAITAEEQRLPGLSELGARSTALTDFVGKSAERLQQLSDLKKQREELAGIVDRFRKITEEIQPLGPPDGWYVDRLKHYLEQYGQIRQGLNELQQRLTTRQQDVEKIHLQLKKDRESWAVWEKELLRQDVELPRQTISQVTLQLDRLGQQVKLTTAQLLQQQEELGAFSGKLLQSSAQLNDALDSLRKATFRKNAHSFLTLDYYRQFNSQLRSQFQEGVSAALIIDPTYLKDNVWLFGLMLLALLVITVLISRYRNQFRETEDWQFFLAHPFAAGSVVVMASFVFWISSPPPLFRLFMLSWAVIATTILAVSLLPSRRQSWIIKLAAVVFMLNSMFEMIALPQPLLRLYILLLAVMIIPLLVRFIRHSVHSERVLRGRFYRAVLRLAIAVLTLSFLAQAAGYMNFSVWLLNATFDTVLIVLFANMALRLGGGGIEFLISRLSQSDYPFFTHFGKDLAKRLKRVLKILAIGIALFYLLPVWRVFTSFSEGWTVLSEFSLSVGEFSISAQMVVLAGVAFYLALQVSWLLQGLCETEVFSNRPVDRGVRDAIKKLIHYGIVLIGFLTALSILGLGLQNFVVLLGAFGVGIGFGLQDIVNNFLSGLILLFERPIKVGDGVLIDGEYGTVIRIGMRSTVVQTLDEAELIVPNSHMISQKVTNWTLSNRRVRAVIPVGVAYGSDLEKVLAILTEAGEQHPEILKDPKPSPFFVQFGASSLDFELRVWISNVDIRPRIKNELLLYIDRRFREEGIEIPFSQHDLHLRSISPGVMPLPTKEA